MTPCSGVTTSGSSWARNSWRRPRRRFTVCGYYADNNPLFYQDGYSSTVAGFPALTMAGALDDAPADASYQLWASVEDRP